MNDSELLQQAVNTILRLEAEGMAYKLALGLLLKNSPETASDLVKLSDLADELTLPQPLSEAQREHVAAVLRQLASVS